MTRRFTKYPSNYVQATEDIQANLSTELHHMSKDRLERVVSQISYIVNNDTLSSSNRLTKISSLLSKLNLH